MSPSSSDDDGLPLPDVPYRFPKVPGPHKVPDSTGCTPVAELLEGARQMASEPTERWNDEIPVAAREAGTKIPTAPLPPKQVDSKGSKPGTPEYFDPVDRTIDHFSDGGLAAIGAGFSFLFNPIATSVHDIYAARINAWQAAFKRDHKLELEHMTQAIGRVDDAAKAMGDVLNHAPEMDPRVDEIMKEKSELGDRLLKDIEDCLRKSKPGPDRDRLEGLWKDVREWMADRDARLEADRREVRQLQQALDAVKAVSTVLQADLVESAAQARKMWSAGMAAPLIHASPNSVMFAAALRAHLMSVRDRLDKAITGS